MGVSVGGGGVDVDVGWGEVDGGWGVGAWSSLMRMLNSLKSP